jgi:4-hydroxybenzoate polyprenyltransferase
MYFFVLVWGMFVAADRVSDLWQPAAILAFLINGLSLFSGFVINSYSDYPIDIRSPIKNHIAHGVDTLGHRRVLVLYWAEQVVTLGMAAVISQMLDNWVFVVVKFVGMASGYIYNAEPIRLKRHGLWNPLMMGIRFGFVPGLIAYLAVHHGVITAGGWLLLVGMTLISVSRGFWNTISDVDEDAAEHIRTPSVVYGALATMRVAWLILVPSLVCSVWGLLLLFGSWGAAGAVGMLGALVYRAMLLRRVHDDRSAIDLMRTPGIRKADGRWSKWTYYTVAAAGIAHFIL